MYCLRHLTKLLFKKLFNLPLLNYPMKKRGQIGFEYLVIMGFVTFVIVGILSSAFLYSGTIKDQIKINQIENCANKITSSSESIFYAGYPSRATTSCYMPDNILETEILEDTIFITIQTHQGQMKRGYTSNVPISGTISLNHGINKIQIIAEELSIALSNI